MNAAEREEIMVDDYLDQLQVEKMDECSGFGLKPAGYVTYYISRGGDHGSERDAGGTGTDGSGEREDEGPKGEGGVK